MKLGEKTNLYREKSLYMGVISERTKKFKTTQKTFLVIKPKVPIGDDEYNAKDLDLETSLDVLLSISVSYSRTQEIKFSDE